MSGAMVQRTVKFRQRGKDGDGVQYIYKLFDHELTDAERTSNIPVKPATKNANGEWLPISGDPNWYDEPLAPTSAMPFCYCSVIKEIGGVWGNYEKLGLWSKWAADGQNSIRLSLDNEHEDFLYNDDGTLVSPAGGATSVIRLYDGQTERTSAATLKVYDDYTETWVNATGANASAAASISGTTLTVSALRADSVKVRVRAEYPANSGTYYYADFTANKVYQDKYDLVVKPNAIPYNPETYPQAGVTIRVSAKRTDLQGNQSAADISTGNTGYLRLFMGYVQSDGTIYNLVRQKNLSPVIDRQTAADYIGIYFELRRMDNASAADSSTDYRICDYETVEIAKAENGDTYRNVDAYKVSDTVPSSADRPTATTVADNTTDVGNGWSLVRPSDTAKEVSIGSGESASQYLPLSSFYKYSLSQQIYTAAEIGAAGRILSLSLYNAGTAYTRTLSIYIVHTPKSSFSSNHDWIPVSISDLVFSGNVTFDAGEWTKIPLQKPFDYAGNNIAITIDDNTGSNSGSSSDCIQCRTFFADNMALYSYSDSTDYDVSNPPVTGTNIDTYKNQLKIDLAANIYVRSAKFKNGTIIPTGTVADWSDPVKWNGEDGNDAASIVFDPAIMAIPSDKDGNCPDGYSRNIGVALLVNGSPITLTNLTVISKPTGISTTANIANSSINATLTSEYASDFEGSILVSAVGTRNGVTYSTRGTITVVASKQGLDSVRIDLDNQADLISCTASGKVRNSRTITTHARIFDGPSQATSGVTAPSAASLILAGVTPTVTLANGIVTIAWNFSDSVILSSPSYSISIPLTYGGKTYSQTFSLTTTNASAVYQVAPYPNEIVFTRQGTSLVPASQNATCDYTLDEGNGPVKDTVNKSNIGPLHLSLYYRYINASGTSGSWQSYTSAVAIPNTTAYKAIEFGIGTSASEANMLDMERVPIIRDGASGTITQTLYQSTNSATAPSRPTGDSPSGWSAERTSITTSNRYRYVTSRSSNDGGTTWSNWSQPVLDAYLAEDGTSIRINGDAVAIAQGSETLDDVDRAYSGGIPDGGIVLMNSTADTAEDAYIRDRQNDDWIEIPVAEGDGYLMNGHLWMRTSASGASNPTKRWKDCGQIQGPKGDDAVLYKLECNPSQINFRSNPVGEFSGSVTVTTIIKRTTGNATPVVVEPGAVTGVYLYCLRVGIDGTGYYPYSESTHRTVTAAQAIDANTPVTAIKVCLSTAADNRDVMESNILDILDVPVICDGRRGAVGATGQMFYPMGVWDVATTYTKQGNAIPLVWVDDLNEIDPSSGEYGAYWYLTADSDIGHKPEDGSQYWAKASHFGLVITRGIFAAFAHLGTFIMSGDWMFSTNGTIDGTLYTRGGVCYGKPAYMWFNPDYPHTDHITDDKHNFIPKFAVDGLTGRTYQNEAFIRGEIHATSGEFSGKITSSEGTIGGFRITDKSLTNDAAVRGNIVQIQNQYVRSTIGACDIPINSADELYGARISSDFFSNEIDSLNVAIRARAKGSGAAYNFALHGWGHIVSRGACVGYQLQVMTLTSQSPAEYINLKAGNLVLLRRDTAGERYAFLPTLANVRDSLRIPATEAFAVKLTLFVADEMHLRGYQSDRTYDGDNYPPHQRDNFFTDHPNHDVSPGQVYTYMLVWDGQSGHTHYNAWLVGYGDRGY